MVITEIGRDIISLNEDNYLEKIKHKIHIINLKFKSPNRDKMDVVLENFNKTNRFIISDNIKFYNNYLRNTNKKYYVLNNVNDGLITFFKKNNKVILNTFNLTDAERIFLYNNDFLIDVLCNLEVIITDLDSYESKKQIYNNWPGNLVIFNNVETNDF